jgi:hypothetical protein
LKQLLNGVSRWQRALVAFIDNGRVLQLAEVKEGEVRPSQTGKRRAVGNGPIVARAGGARVGGAWIGEDGALTCGPGSHSVG